MKQYLGDNVSTDAISARLRDSCPSLYSLDDAKCSKASEILQSIIESTSREDRQEKLTQAMQVLDQYCTSLLGRACMPYGVCAFTLLYPVTSVVVGQF